MNSELGVRIFPGADGGWFWGMTTGHAPSRPEGDEEGPLHEGSDLAVSTTSADRREMTYPALKMTDRSIGERPCQS
jgi:hypothetical protein